MNILTLPQQETTNSSYPLLKEGIFQFDPSHELYYITGTVKWFSPYKGFGFIVPQEGVHDLFIHFSVVERAGLRRLYEGDEVQCKAAVGIKGDYVVELCHVIAPHKHSYVNEEEDFYGYNQEIESLSGSVKWFNRDRGFGFVSTKEGEDIFLHITVLQQSGLESVMPGQEIKIRTIHSCKGLQAIAVEDLGGDLSN